MSSTFNYPSYISLIKELLGENYNKKVAEADFIKSCKKKVSRPINIENLKFFGKNHFISQ